MKVIEITGPRECAVVERPTPFAADNYVVVKILAAPMCTEVREYKAGMQSDCLGHEAAGEVVEVAGPGPVSVGDRVIVMPLNGCGRCELCLAGEHIHCLSPRDPYAATGNVTGQATYAQYCIKQNWNVLKIPDDISTLHASLACCGLGPTFNAMNMMLVNGLDTVLVSGCGAVGLGAVVNARVRGARVIALEGHPWRAQLAKKLGVEAVIDPSAENALEQVLELTAGRGADKSVECSSADTAPAFLVKSTRKKGEIATVGWGGPVLAKDLTAKGLTFRGVWHWNHVKDSHAMFETIRRAGPLLDTFITHTFPMSRVKDAWELQVTGECGKVILDPWA